MYCYCDFTGGGVPNTLDYEPAAGGAITSYQGDGAVSSTDSTEGASCYSHDVSFCKHAVSSVFGPT